jgi:hypothetical protein
MCRDLARHMKFYFLRLRPPKRLLN